MHQAIGRRAVRGVRSVLTTLGDWSLQLRRKGIQWQWVVPQIELTISTCFRGEAVIGAEINTRMACG